MKVQYDIFSPLHKRLGFAQMTEFDWLSEDRLVQKTVFGEQAELVANFPGVAYEYSSHSLPPDSLLVFWNDTGESQVYNIKG